MAELALLFVLLVGLAAPLALYLLVQRETSERTEMSRADAEAYARQRASERYGSNERGTDEAHDRE